MSLAHRCRRFAPLLLALLVLATLFPATSASSATPTSPTNSPPVEAPWWVDWLAAFDRNDNRIDDKAESIAKRALIKGNRDALVPVLVTFEQVLPAQRKAFLDFVGAAPDAFFFKTQPVADIDIPVTHLGRLTQVPGVAAVEYDQPVRPVLGVSGPATQAHNGTGANTFYNGRSAEDLGYTGQGMVVAVLDTGVQDQHGAFAGKWIAGAHVAAPVPVDCVNPVDDDGHGTHVASTAVGAQAADNLYGTAKAAKLVEIKISASLGAASVSIGGIARGFEFVKRYNNAIDAGRKLCGPNDDRIDVATLSFGSTGRGGPNAGTDEPFIDALVNSGVAVTIAVGNCGPQASATCSFSDTDNGISSPGNAAGAIAVGSFDDKATVNRDNDIISGFSSRGPNNQSGDTAAGGATGAANLKDRFRKPEIAAPGQSITAAGPVPFTLSTLSGTSMATPHVAGIAALLLEAGEKVKDQTGGINLMASRANGYSATGDYVKGAYPVRDAIIHSPEYKAAGAETKWTGPNSAGLTWNNAWGYGQVNAFDALCWAWKNVLVPGGATAPGPVAANCDLSTTDPTLSPSPTDSTSPSPTASPSTSPTPSGPSTTYYFHSLSGNNTIDQPMNGATFDTEAPVFGPDEYSVARDLPGFQNAGLIEVVDPTWRGTLEAPATSIGVDFWGEQIPDQDLGEIHYTVRVLPQGATSYIELLPAIARPETEIGPVNVQHTFTEMKIGTGTAQPLALPAGPLTFTIRGTFVDSDVSTEIYFDATNYNSSFTVNPEGGVDPDPTVTASPTTSPTATPTPTPTSTTTPSETQRYYWHAASRSHQADQMAGGATFDATEPTGAVSAVSADTPVIRGAPFDSRWVGSVAPGAIKRLEFDFWYRSPSVGAGSYDVSLAAGPPFVDTLVGNIPVPTTGADPQRVRVSLDLAQEFVVPADQQLRLTLHSLNATAPQSIVFDSAAHPSGFIVNPEPRPVAGECDGTAAETKEPGRRGSYTESPNDPCYDKQWGMDIVRAPEAWATGATGHQVRVAVIDSGLDLGHPDFACPGKLDLDKAAAVIDGKVLRGAKAQDIDGHGTHVAGIVGACTNNGTGVVGVAPDATIIPYRVFTAPEEGAGQLNDIAVAIEQAADDGAHVINMSLGIGIGALPFVGGFIGYTPDLFPEIDRAIEYAQSKGVVVVIAAGNSFVLPLCEYPAIAEKALCVGSTDRNDLKSVFGTFPNKPPSGTPTADRPMGPSISAPGGLGNIFGIPQLCPESIFSTYLRTASSSCSTEGYEAIDGTSMASPHVAGAAALLYDRLGGERSDANRQLINDRLLDTAKDLGTPGYDPVYGYGRLDVLAAVDGFGSTEPETIPTTLVFSSDMATSGQYSDEATIAARLVDDQGNPVVGADVSFRMVGAEETTEWSATTDEDGVASSVRRLSGAPGQYQLFASFQPEEGPYEPSSDTTDFVIELEDSVTSLEVGPATGNGKDKTRALTATVTDEDSQQGLGGLEVAFYCDGTLVATVTTGADGAATTQSPKNCANGSHEYRVDFNGDSYYIGSSDSETSSP